MTKGKGSVVALSLRVTSNGVRARSLGLGLNHRRRCVASSIASKQEFIIPKLIVKIGYMKPNEVGA